VVPTSQVRLTAYGRRSWALTSPAHT